MADEADCPVCGGAHPVTWLITHLNPAATIRSCEEDFEAAVLALLANRLEVDAGWLSDVINTAVDLVNRDITEAGGDQEGATAADGLDPDDDARPYMPVTGDDQAGYVNEDTDDDDTRPAAGDE